MKLKVAALMALGLLQMAGDLIRFPALKTAGAASGASPAPKVFCAVRGYEAYSTTFFIEWLDADDGFHSRPLSADALERLRGPYNRRNVYGAALAYGPVLPAELRDPVLKYALSGEAPILRELGVDPATVRYVRVRYEPLPGVDYGPFPRILSPEIR